MGQQLILSIPAPVLTYDAYADLQGQKVKDVVNAVARGRLPVYQPPTGPDENPAKVKKYINMVALFADAAKQAGIEINLG
ncbi:DNA-binding protein [Pseudoalteromonas sp. McH1-42]|uniref:DNA-binding protein n=1 Tax=Pseudoalteromonas sp. McH1-42 TaxID=2917752 RepID=UPI001EF6AA49|nr:DNA-binding protein [Pseudoalteromonas sp. McH1-42]MCG7563331.1 DNA-binding protein [Pseudoalteromonas sp. McH1-42]